MTVDEGYTGGTDPLVAKRDDGTHVPYVKVQSNVTTKFREAFETYNPTTGSKWAEIKASGDLLFVDGNAAAASYLVISKDPLTPNTVTQIETMDRFKMPIEVSFGLHMSQRVLGQEFAVEVVSDEEVAPVPDIAIASISQAASVLTINTTEPHGLVPGKRIGVGDVSDSRLNYPALVVASIPSSTQITCTAGPMGNLPAVTAGPFASGSIFFRSALGFAENGTSVVFEGSSATQASIYVRSESGDALPSGTVTGNQLVTVGSTASIQAFIAANTRTFQPTTEFKLSLMADRVQWSDSAVDTVAASTNRTTRTQVVPSSDALYKLRIRATNHKSLTAPIAKIVSATKTGTTTATVVTDLPHGLMATDLIQIVGARDQSGFPNWSYGAAIASIVNDTTFTVVWGSAITATTFGGSVIRVQGGNVLQGSINNGNVQSVSRANNIVTIVTSAAVSNVLIGDCINAHGLRSAVNGSDLGLDGAYRVRDIQTTTVVLEPIGNTPTGANVVSTNCGGMLIKRTDLRISFVRIFDYERDRVEIMARPSGDISGAVGVAVQNIPAVTVNNATVTTVSAVTNAGTPAAPTDYALNSAANTNLNLIVAGTTGVQSLYATNIGAAAAFVKLYNKATTPTSTDVPVMIIPVPAMVGVVPGVAQINPGFNGLRFVLGLGIAITGGSADSDATAVAAGQVKVKISRTA